ncbi:phospholipase D family protein [Modestobacter italicus]|uniref:phospholipase D family protein n=1 Tax=Modestobacter italicus (strain DSM 44449 / CECT 9708 / BC 501) TaxID=2732864 RepID=UPI0027E0E26D|nr:phospholipase [Modestobacter italicus]
MPRTDLWLLSERERANAATRLPAWRPDNLAEPLVHGAGYFDRLVEEVRALTPGDHLFFADWRGDPDERLRPEGPTVAELFSDAAARGVHVRGLVWRSHWDGLSFSKAQNRSLDREVEAGGGRVVLDQRVRAFGSHHQKFVVLRHQDDPTRDVAYLGGIDLCHSRRDDAGHRGDPQPVGMSPAFGPRPAWHDVQLQVRGPVVADVDAVFRERWSDPTSPVAYNPIAWLRGVLRGARLHPEPLPDPLPAPPAAGPHQVQLLRTYPQTRSRYPFAPRGERSVARGHVKALARASRLVYREDQYLWSADAAAPFAAALRREPDLHLVVVLPRRSQQDGVVSRAERVGRCAALDLLREAGGGRVHVFDVESPDGLPVYVHAKVEVVDDVWAAVGSDNVDRRSWTHDSELCGAVLDPTPDPREPRDPAGRGDGARVIARELRLALAREHLDRAPDGSQDDDLLDPGSFVAALEATAAALEAWHAGGRRGPRPPGRLRPHVQAGLSRRGRLWAVPVYRVLHDPDDRPRWMRRRGLF